MTKTQHIKDPGSAITHFIGMLMAIFAAVLAMWPETLRRRITLSYRNANKKNTNTALRRTFIRRSYI